MQLVRYVMDRINHIAHSGKEFGDTGTHFTNLIITCSTDFNSKVTICHLRYDMGQFFYWFNYKMYDTFNYNSKDKNTYNSNQKHDVTH